MSTPLRHRLEQSERRTDPHKIAGFFRREKARVGRDQRMRRLDRLADPESTERIALERHLPQRSRAIRPQVRVGAALDDAEQRRDGLALRAQLVAPRKAARAQRTVRSMDSRASISVAGTAGTRRRTS
jgi:hypothetical protein